MKTKNASVMPLNKYLAHAGYTSRRKAIGLIQQGMVSVNGATVTQPGHKVSAEDRVVVSGKVLKFEKYKYILLNKPEDAIATTSDEQGRRTVLDVIGQKLGVRLYPVGRLDRNTTGLLLLTNDGEFAQKLSHPRYKIEKIYQVTLHRPLPPEDLALIAKGVELADGKVQIDRISYIPKAPKTCVRIVLHSGKYRVVRRLFEYLGFYVEALDRVGYAGLSKRNLRVGQWRHLTEAEVERLKNDKDV